MIGASHSLGIVSCPHGIRQESGMVPAKVFEHSFPSSVHVCGFQENRLPAASSSRPFPGINAAKSLRKASTYSFDTYRYQVGEIFSLSCATSSPPHG